MDRVEIVFDDKHTTPLGLCWSKTADVRHAAQS
jgi:hypothetical protein